ncbi:ubiquinol-cytochrome C chaperone family protein [Sphingomicrobium sediminis]|uniref:Ubiquinol-cytochrome C chaperone n=1 Tax=Sphingomicrobium sediminis TaxID=2950949 RepID=A0A9X2EMW5_9SPHN|nr:ubiquinol-cytochrome C chaperone family protein [Sphingomicrobium sediminis]MCM8558137.1 ubiquinol-cytochrome C chaperone [Sphingomicrobium sediminis]
MRKLFSWLGPPPGAKAASLYAALVAMARDKHWYVEGKVSDDLDGRFAILSTLVALATLRLEDGEEDAVRTSVALTEAFIADMDSQMRELGFDTTIGKQVRGLVGALASRVDRWRHASDENADHEEWKAATLFSVYRDEDPGEDALTYAEEQLRRVAERMAGEPDAALIKGDL